MGEDDAHEDRPRLATGDRGKVNVIAARRVYGAASPYPDWETSSIDGRLVGAKPFFRVDSYQVSHVSHRRGDGSHEPVMVREVLERGDAVGVLLYNRDRNCVVVVRQFRLPTLERGDGDGWIVETIAGVVPRDGSRSPEDVAIEETYTEAGYRITFPEPVATFYASPGGTSERIHIFYKEVSDRDKTGPGGGDGTEDIEILEWPLDELSRRLLDRQLLDPKLVIASYYLAERLGFSPTNLARRKLAPGEAPGHYTSPLYPHLRIGIKTGDILGVRDVDIWVNPENRYLMMARTIDRGISASIRWAGAQKFSSGAIRVDTIGNALRLVMDGRPEAHVGEVIETDPGDLRHFGVKRLLHVPVAEAKGKDKAREGVEVREADIAPAVFKALERAQRGNEAADSLFTRLWRLFTTGDGHCRSILIPLVGAGEGGLTAERVVPRVLDGVTDFFARRSTNGSRPELSTVYLLAYFNHDLAQCRSELARRGFTPEPEGTDASAAPAFGAPYT